MDKRDFIRNLASMGMAAAAANLPGSGLFVKTNQKYGQTGHQAVFYSSNEDLSVNCELCPRFCKIRNGESGKCKVRKNQDGQLFAMGYGIISAQNIDPMEKKPLYHFFPGQKIYSVGYYGCNLNCLNCQNAEISQCGIPEFPTHFSTPENLVQTLKNGNHQFLAFTYNEPAVNYEFMLDTAILAKSRGMQTVLVSNGYINHEPLERLLPYIDACNIDLKFFSPALYAEISGGKLQPVLKTIQNIFNRGTHLEITQLIITGINDKEEQCEPLVKWMLASGMHEIPLHFSRFFPRHKMSGTAATEANTVLRLREMALHMGMKYVYTGNLSDNKGSNTYCPECGTGLVFREGFQAEIKNLQAQSSHCSNCSHKIYGIWNF